MTHAGEQDRMCLGASFSMQQRDMDVVPVGVHAQVCLRVPKGLYESNNINPIHLPISQVHTVRCSASTTTTQYRSMRAKALQIHQHYRPHSITDHTDPIQIHACKCALHPKTLTPTQICVVETQGCAASTTTTHCVSWDMPKGNLHPTAFTQHWSVR